MLLDYLKEFEWENEPYDIYFNEEGMNVITSPYTDFWLDKTKNINKKNAHFFYTKKVGDFVCKASFDINGFENFAQCGIMIKLNDKNAFKVSFMSADNKNLNIGTSLSICGLSDWATHNIKTFKNKIYYKIIQKDGVFFVFYSNDDVNYCQIRQFCFVEPLIELQVGAYFASPSEKEYKSVLKNIEVK